MSTKIDAIVPLGAASFAAGVGALWFNVLPLVNATWMAERNLSEDQVGLLASLIMAGFTIGILTAPFWVRRFAWRPLIILGLATMALAIAWSPHLIAPLNWPLLFILAGMGIALIYAPVVTAVGDASDPDRAYGIMYGSQMALAIILSFLFSVLIIPSGGIHGVMYAFAVVAIIAMMGSYWIPNATEPFVPPAGSGGSPASMIIPLSLFGIVLLFLAGVGLWGFLDPLSHDRGLETGASSFLVPLSLVASLLGSVAATITGSRWGREIPIAVAGALMVGGTMLMGVKASSAFVLGLCLMSFGWLYGVAYATALLAVADVSGRFVSLTPAATGLGGVMGPALSGAFIINAGYGWFVLACACVMAVGFAAILTASVSVTRWLDQ